MAGQRGTGVSVCKVTRFYRWLHNNVNAVNANTRLNKYKTNNRNKTNKSPTNSGTRRPSL